MVGFTDMLVERGVFWRQKREKVREREFLDRQEQRGRGHFSPTNLGRGSLSSAPPLLPSPCSRRLIPSPSSALPSLPHPSPPRTAAPTSETFKYLTCISATRSLQLACTSCSVSDPAQLGSHATRVSSHGADRQAGREGWRIRSAVHGWPSISRVCRTTCVTLVLSVVSWSRWVLGRRIRGVMRGNEGDEI